MKRSGLVSTHGFAAENGREVLEQGGSALKAAVTAFFAAAAHSPGVLFSPVSILTGGLGFGSRAYDGRPREPGLGAKRPRGFLTPEEVPEAARAAVPRSLSALALAVAYDSGASLLSCVRPAVALAKKDGEAVRADLLEQVASHGARCLSEPALRRSILAQLGPAAQGQLSHNDLIVPTDVDAPARALGASLLLPWESTNHSPDLALGRGHVILAVDFQGHFVGISFRALSAELILDELGDAFPPLATPVMRGESRRAAGSVIEIPSWLRIERNEQQVPIGILGQPEPGVSPEVLALSRDADTREVSARQFELKAGDFELAE